MFDSGFGGLTVARALIDLMPDEDLVYFGDTGPGFVEFVERGDTRSEQVHVLAERLLAPVKEAVVDTLLLGCTHYPFLARTIGDVMGREIVLVSSADETAFEVRAMLHETGLVRRSGTGGGKGRHRFVSSGDVDWFKELGSQLLGPE